MTNSNHYGLLFGAVVDVLVAIVAVTVMGVLINHHSGRLLDRLQRDITTQYDTSVPDSNLVNSTQELTTQVVETGMDCAETNSQYIMTTNELDASTVAKLQLRMNETIATCQNRTATLEQLVSLVSMELSPNEPTLLQTGTAMATLDGAGSLAVTYSVYQMTLANSLSFVYLVIPPWSGVIGFSPMSAPTLRFHSFSPDLLNLGMCSGTRPLLVNKLEGITFSGYELGCSVASGEVRLFGLPVGSGVLELNKDLTLFGQLQ